MFDMLYIQMLANHSLENMPISIPGMKFQVRSWSLNSKLMKFNLEDRLIDFATLVIDITELLPDNRACNHLAGQLVRSGTAPALIYGEAQSAESRKDFVHKMKIALKELRETRISLRIIDHKTYLEGNARLMISLKESNELISIFVKSIATARENMKANSL